MRHSVAVAALLVVLAASAFGLDVDEVELGVAKDTSVEFINYEGPHSKIETREQIMGIGLYLGGAIASGLESASLGGKYRVVHAVDPSETEKLDADVFMLLPDSVVDHIRNVRLMLTGFLMAAYDYSEQDAAVLGEFITIYNAVFRRKMDYIAGAYKRIVRDNLTNEAAGLSTVYTDWPGKTMMMIPLTEGARDGGIGSLDTDILTEKEVIEELREQEDRGLDSRKDITELKEREVEKEQAAIDEEKRAADQEARRIADQQKQLEEERKQIAAEREKPGADAEALQTRERQIAEREETLREDERVVVEKQEELVERGREQEERVEQIQTEREQIATDERELIGQEEPEATEARTTGTAVAATAQPQDLVLFVEIQRLAGETLGRLVYLDGESGEVAAASTLNTVRNRRFLPAGSSIVVVAGTTTGQGAVRLMVLDSETLEISAEGADDVYPGTAVLVDGDSIFAVVAQGEAWHIGKFDVDLALLRVSDLEVDPESYLALFGEDIYAQGTDGALLILPAQSLTTRIVRP